MLNNIIGIFIVVAIFILAIWISVCRNKGVE